MDGKIYLIPIGPVRVDILDWLQGSLPVTLRQKVEQGATIPIPAAAYSHGRDQYCGETILSELQNFALPKAERLLGLVDYDCYAPGLNFIFGQAMPHGPAFVALPRLRPSFYHLPEDPELFHQRLLKEAVHELGHTWGLPHCPDPECVMHFSNALPDTDHKSNHYCARCRKRLPF